MALQQQHCRGCLFEKWVAFINDDAGGGSGSSDRNMTFPMYVKNRHRALWHKDVNIPMVPLSEARRIVRLSHENDALFHEIARRYLKPSLLEAIIKSGYLHTETCRERAAIDDDSDDDDDDAAPAVIVLTVSSTQQQQQQQSRGTNKIHLTRLVKQDAAQAAASTAATAVAVPEVQEDAGDSSSSSSSDEEEPGEGDGTTLNIKRLVGSVSRQANRQKLSNPRFDLYEQLMIAENPGTLPTAKLLAAQLSKKSSATLYELANTMEWMVNRSKSSKLPRTDYREPQTVAERLAVRRKGLDAFRQLYAYSVDGSFDTKIILKIERENGIGNMVLAANEVKPLIKTVEAAAKTRSRTEKDTHGTQSSLSPASDGNDNEGGGGGGGGNEDSEAPKTQACPHTRLVNIGLPSESSAVSCATCHRVITDPNTAAAAADKAAATANEDAEAVAEQPVESSKVSCATCHRIIAPIADGTGKVTNGVAIVTKDAVNGVTTVTKGAVDGVVVVTKGAVDGVAHVGKATVTGTQAFGRALFSPSSATKP